MYRLMIVEDEQAIAQGIANSLPWEEWGFQISRVCSNGEEALEAIAVECPDLVLSDIRMPKMDGLELMKRLNKEYPHIRIVILSGYNDFEYLQTAIQNGVSEYLLKPTDIDEFEEVFRKMKKKLDEDVERRLSDEEARQLREQKRCNALKDTATTKMKWSSFLKENVVSALCSFIWKTVRKMIGMSIII